MRMSYGEWRLSSLLALDKKEMLKEYSPKGVDRVLPSI